MKSRIARIIPFLLLCSLLLTSMLSGCETSSEQLHSSVDASEENSIYTSDDTSSGNTVSDESLPEVSVPDESTPDESTPEESIPEESTPDVSEPDESTPDDPTPDEPIPDDPTPDIPNDANALGGYENINLTYTFRYGSSSMGRHSESDFMPYVAYLDTQGNIKDYFFDSYLFLPCMGYGPSGARMHTDAGNPTKAIDWTTYVEDTFAPYANVNALETAFGKVKSTLGDKDKKAGVFLTILYPAKTATNFGTLGGKSLNFSKTEDRKYAIKWMIDEQIKLYNNAGYKNLELVGFYWLEEFLVDNDDVELMQYTSSYLHSKGLKFIWIPWYVATGYNIHETLGFDVACMQPNLFWMEYTDPNRVENSIRISKEYGLCMEMELDFRVSQPYYYNRYLYYLEGGMNGGMMDEVKMYYQDTGPGVYYSACYSADGLFRSVYDLTYKYAKGTLTKRDIDYYRPEGVDDNFVSNIGFNDIYNSAKWVSIGKSYTGCHSYVDGNGMPYQEVSGKELTDGIIASEELSTDWFAFHTSIRDNQGRYSITVDLGEVVNGLAHFAAHFDNKQLYGIGAPSDIQIYTSTDGVNFTYYDTAELEMDQNYSAFYIEGAPVSARYIKMSIGHFDKSFVFCSEFLVGVDK